MKLQMQRNDFCYPVPSRWSVMIFRRGVAKHPGISSYRCETNAGILRFAQNGMSFELRSYLRRSVIN